MMSGAGAEVGSGADVRFNAQQANATIAARLTQPQAMPTDEEILTEAKKQLQEMQEQTKESRKILGTLEKILDKTPQFKRLG